ncbi:MAG: hypothetical protein LBH81_02115 [Rickettsiales bacterium]|jgi:hypothetical protein|nr:hypothetical protein [Rickettsiales bacterium]
MKKLVSLFALVLFTGAAMADTRDPRQTQNYSAGKGAGAASVSASFGGGAGMNLVTEAPAFIEQQRAAEEQAEYERLNAPLPVRVGNRNLEMMIRNGDTSAGVDMEDLQLCASIYSNAVFAWDRPNYQGASTITNLSQYTCVMEVDLVAFVGTQRIVVATMRAPVGSTFECNIDSFPPEGYQPAIEQIVLPADHEPTLADVEKQMSKEREKNATAKTVAGILIGGLMGNMIGAPAAGTNDTFGMGGNKIATTLGGAAIGGTGMYAAQQVGHTAGSTVESALVGGAAGAVMGNMTAGVVGGGSVLDIRKCKEGYCLVGRVFQDGNENTEVFCEAANINKCVRIDRNTSGVKVEKSVSCRDFAAQGCVEAGKEFNANSEGCRNARFADIAIGSNERQDATGKWIKGKCTVGGTSKAALAPWSGSKSITLAEFNKDHSGKVSECVIASESGAATGENCTKPEVNSFQPGTLDASDGGVVDFNNAARNTGTLIGTGAGAGIGGLAGYKGASQALSDRHVAAVQEYADSLRKFRCESGSKILDDYKKTITIPVPLQ